MGLAMIVPTKGRPLNAERLVHTVNGNAGDELDLLLFAVDHDEPLIDEYRAAIPADSEYEEWAWVQLAEVQASPQRIGPILNHLAADLAARYSHIGFMGDDHLPRTSNWDEHLVEALGGRPGVAYGNDLVQGEKLPTAAVISSDIVRSLGFLVPPPLEHLYFDDFWKLLGAELGNLRYCEGVVIEHLHPTVGKARWDDGYAQANSADQFRQDRGAYDAFLAQDWPGCLARLKSAGLGCR